MWTIATIALILSSCSIGNPLEFVDLLRSMSVPATTAKTNPGSTPESYTLAVTQISHDVFDERIDLRQVLTVQPVATLPVTETAPAVLDANVNTGMPSVASMISIASMASMASMASIAPAPPAAPVAAPADSSADMPINPTTIALPAFPVTPPQPPADLTLTTAAISPVAGQTQDPSVFVTVQWLETWIGGTSRTWLPHTITLYQGAPARTGPLPGKGEIGMGTLTGELGITQTVVQGGAMTAGPEWKMGAVAAVGLGVAGII